MQLGMIGLGRMGGNMVRRLMRNGHKCVGFARDAAKVADLAKEGMTVTTTMKDFVAKLEKPRAAWVMVPAGDSTEQTVMQLAELMEKGDTIIDGGNSMYKDDVRRAKALSGKGINYVDVGTSGGVWGVDRGYCLMVGGPNEAVKRIEPILRTLAPGRGNIDKTPGRDKKGGTAEEGFLHCGASGGGHFTKMIHNGIEYGIMQAYAEGLDILKNANSTKLPEGHRFNFDLADICEVWRRGSVVGSWLLDLTTIALTKDAALTEYEGHVADSGEGKWTVEAALAEDVPADVLTASLFVRFRSRQTHTFAEKALSAMRAQFGGHKEKSQG
ncbi:MAG: decarboxylating 6-phosphogluconate dehydrogenase [Planctomycetes bacterium]|nr:decarboxylating 6-phosphogluconate dehydrogenase [Planctomycetota bacterium]